MNIYNIAIVIAILLAIIISIYMIISFIISFYNFSCKKNKTLKTNDDLDKLIDTIGPTKIVKELELKKYL
jgi:hypothetical protein